MKIRTTLTVTVAAITLAVVTMGRVAIADEIHDAVKDGNLDKVKALVAANKEVAGAKLEKNDATPLHAAAAEGKKDIAEFLVKSGADVNAKMKNGMTPLHLAAIKGNKDICELLLTNKAEVDARNGKEMTPLMSCVWDGEATEDVVALLLANKADPSAKSKSGYSLMQMAMGKGYQKVAQMLQQAGGK